MSRPQSDLSLIEEEDTRPGRSYLSEGWTLGSWLGTREHKRIALLYAVSITDRKSTRLNSSH